MDSSMSVPQLRMRDLCLRKLAQSFAQAMLSFSLIVLLAGCESASFEPAERALVPAPATTSPIAPLPLAPPDIDPARIALGRDLFFDRILSPDGQVRCPDCHDLARAGTDGRTHSQAPSRPEGGINVPGIYNLAWVSRFMWSGRFDSIQGPLTVAMTAAPAMGGDFESAVARVAAEERYEGRFESVYGGAPTEAMLRDALASFVFSLTSPDAPFDRYLRGEEDAIPPLAAEGYRIFRDYGCVSCHQGVNVGGNMFQRFGALRDPFAGRANLTPADMGLYSSTQREEDRHVFRVPSLRNVALTAPYFHDGSAQTLEEAITVMARHQLGRTLEPEQVAAVAAFLRSLTGRMDHGEPQITASR